MRRIAGFAALLTAALVTVPTVGFAAWSSPATGSGSVIASRVIKASTPTLTRSGPNVVVAWSAGALSNGGVATGYVVRRTVGATTTTICTVTDPTRACTDTAPAPGLAGYVVSSLFHNWTGPSSDSAAITFDANAPTTTLTSNPVPNANGYNLTAPTITLTATDVESSVASITYKIGSASPVTVNAATTSFTVSSLGSTAFTYYATDTAGNVETTKTYTVKRDGTAPTTTVTASPAPNANGYFASAPTLTLTATDAETSVASITYQVGAAAVQTVPGASANFNVSTLGNTTITYFATDAAGNVEATKTYTVKRDSTAPSTVAFTDPANGSDYKLGNNGVRSWTRTCSDRTGVCVAASDAESTITNVTFKLVTGTTCWNGTAFVSAASAGSSCNVAATFDSANNDWFSGIAKTLVSAGTYSVTATATNEAGLSTTSAANTFTISN